MKNNIKAIILIVFFWTIVLSSYFEQYSTYLSYVDEGFVVLSIVFYFFKQKIDQKILSLWLLVLFFCVTILTASVFSEYFRGYELSILDLFLFLKPILLFLAISNISQSVRKNFISYLSSTGSFFLILAILGYFINIYVPIFPAFDQRLGFKSYSFIFPNPGEFLNIIIILTLGAYSSSSNKNINVILYVGIFLAITTLRFKALVMIAFSILVIIYLGRIEKYLNKKRSAPFLKKNKIFSIRRIMFLFLLSLIPGWYQFKSYFLTGMTPRLFLLVNSVPLSLAFFPFGAGPGTYGSAVAKLVYSPVYIKLGFYKFYGLSDFETNFLSDNFWPMVIGQYGFFGLILICYIYSKIFKYMKEHIDAISVEFRCFIILSMSLALSTLGSAILIGPIGCLYIIFISCLLKKVRYS